MLRSEVVTRFEMEHQTIKSGSYTANLTNNDSSEHL